MKTKSSNDGKKTGKGKITPKKQNAILNSKIKTATPGKALLPSRSDEEIVASPGGTTPTANEVEHKRTEAATFEEQDLLRTLMDNLTDSIYFKDAESHFTRINQALAHRIGLRDPAKAIGKTDSDFFSDEHSRQAYEDEQKIIKVGQPLIGKEEKETWPDGREAWVSTTKMPLRNQKGQIIGTFGISRDITERKRADEALQQLYAELEKRVQERTADLGQSEAKLRAVFAAMQDLVFVIDRNGIYRDIAPTNPELLYRPARDLLGKSLYDVFPEEQAEQFMSIIRNVIDEGKTKQIEYELPIQGKQLWFSASVTPMNDSNSLWVARDITDRKRVEDVHREERNLLRSIIDATPVQIFVKDKQGIKIVANKADWQASGGKTMEDVVGKTDFDTYSAELAAKFWADDKMVMDTETPILDHEESTRDANGNTVWVLTTKVPMYDSQGKTIGVVGVSRDITERKRAEEALKESEEKYHLHFGAISDIIISYDRDFKVLFVSPSVKKVLGYSPEELIGKNLAELNVLTPSSKATALAYGKRVLDGESIASIEYEFITKDGRKIIGDVSGAPLSENGKIVGVIAVGRDITERKLAEEKLHASDARFRAVVDNNLDGVVFSDAKGQILYSSPSIEQIIGYSAEERVGASLFELIHPDDRDDVKRKIAALTQAPEAATSAQFRTQHKNGSWRWVEAFAKNMLEDPNVQSLVISARDITERKSMEEALKEERSLLRTLIDTVPDFVYVKDIQGRKLISNEADWRACGGKTMEDIVGKTDFETYPAELAEKYWADDKFVIDTGTPVINREELARDEQGNTIWNLTTKVPFRDRQGQIAGLVGVSRNIAERKRMEETLKQERNLLRTLIDATPDKIFVKDTQGRKIVANLADWKSSGGKTMEDVLGKTDFDTYPADLAAKYWSDDKMVMEAGTPIYNNEEPSRDAQGKPVWTLTTKVPLKDGQGHIIGLVGIARDITEHRLAEEAHRSAEAKYRILVEEIPAITYIDTADGSGLTSFVSPQIETILGIPQQEWMESDNNYWLNMIHPDDRERVATAHQRTMDNGEPFNEEYRMFRRDGQMIWIEDHSKLLKDDAGKPISLHGVMFDVTESKQAEAALRNSQQMLQTVLDTIPVRVFWKDRKSHYLGSNLPFALDAGQLSPHELLDKDDYQMTWREQADAYRSDDRQVMDTGVPKIGYEEPQTTPHGGRIWLRTSKVPLLDSEGNIIGVLGTYEDITQQKTAEERILQLNRLYAMLSQINQVIVRVQNQEALFHEICRAAIEQGGYRMAWIGLCDETSHAIKPIAFAGHEQRYLSRIQVSFNPDLETGRGPSGTAIRENRCITCQDIATDPRMELWREEGLQRGYHSVASVPFQQQGKVIGILSVYSGEVNAFTTDDEELLTEISRDISFALNRMAAEAGRKRAEERIHQQVERLTALTAIDQAISSSFDLHISLSILLFHAAKQLKVDALAVMLLNPNLNILEYYSGRGFRNAEIEKTTVGLRDEGAGRVALNRQLVAIPDLSNSPLELSRGKILEAESIVSYYGVPLIAKGKIKGVLEAFHRSPLNPDREWLDFLNTLAGQAAIAVDNSQLFDGLQRSNAELRMAYDTTIEGWSHALDLRDKETEGHTQRVVEMTMKLADAAGMTEEEMVHVRRGALLHDIGKMGIPDSILLKTGELTEEEKDIMHRHPSLAYEMLSRIDYLRPALDIPYCHHEKWDGTGYPRGLKGEQIPLAARLFAIVDVWDALRSDRTYRKSWPEEKVFEYIRSLTGTYFDPHVVEMFFDEFNE